MTPETESQLNEHLSEPTAGVIETLKRLEGDLLILGVAGKMGPTLARMALRASEAAGIRRRVIGVSRFSQAGSQRLLNDWGIETIACDLLDESQVAALPEAPNVLHMPALKFGATGNEPRTWAVNTWLPSLVCRKYRRSRIVAFSTGNVYGMAPVIGGGSRETDLPNPVGEYAMSCLGRERMFQYFSETLEVPLAIIRLNYACELRYGVLVDIAQAIQAGQSVDLSMGHFNTLWQGDANAMTLQAFAETSSPATLINVTGPESLSIRKVADRFGELLGKPVRFTGKEGEQGLLNNAQPALGRFGSPRVTPGQMIEWIARWVLRGGPTLGKPTHFQTLDGKF